MRWRALLRLRSAVPAFHLIQRRNGVVVERPALEVVLTDETLRTTMEEATPLKRIGDPEDIAAAIVYLCSPAGGYVTGKVVEVDGGLDHPNLDMGMPDL